MSLTSGTKLGPYEVQSQLGAGGMGEVYRAKDSRLDRTVAVKILPSHLSDNPDAKQRFDREARSISSLNHPNICTLHDVGHQDGIDFLVMEFLDGETLADRLAKGPLPTELVLKYGIEICEGLERAHKSGVVHRDLKPGNVMLTKTGAKLMDFGLAKAIPGGAAPASSLTMTIADQPLTGQGTIIGTFQYMSPEQTEGKEADARSDIFSLGAMLYEMVTGKRAFTGKSQASLVAAILASEPAPISVAQPMTPPALAQVVKTCLAKDPEERFQTVHDLKLQLKWIAEASSSQLAAPAQVRARRVVQKRTLVIAAIVGWILAAAALAIFLSTRSQLREARRPVTASWTPPGDMEFAPVLSGAPALSPDGSKLAFLAMAPRRGDTQRGTAVAELWIRDLGTGTVRRVEGAERPTFPFWSPDGKYIGFFSAAKMKKVALAGGPVQVLCDAPEGRGASWNARGVIIFTPNIYDPLFKVAEGGGLPEKITETKPDWSNRNPYFLPDGDHFLFNVRDTRNLAVAGALYGASLSGDRPRQILERGSNVQYSEGYLLYLLEGVLVAQRFDPKSLKFTGNPEPVAEKLDYWNPRDLAAFTAAHGTLVFRHGSLRKTQPMWVDRTGKELGRFGEPGLYSFVRPSPDGSLIGLVRSDPDTGRGDVWMLDTGRNTVSRSTFAEGDDVYYAFSPDAKKIAVTTLSKGAWIQPASGSGDQEKLNIPLSNAAVVNWSPNGRYLFLEVQNSATRFDIYYIDLNGDRKITPFLHSPANENDAVLSPNGKWLAYNSDESGRAEVYVTAFPGSGGKWQVSSGGGNFPSWSADGKQLYYTSGDKLMSAPILNVETFEFGAPAALPIHLNDFATIGPPAPGERFPALKPLSGGQPQPQEVILNWPGLLRK